MILTRSKRRRRIDNGATAEATRFLVLKRTRRARQTSPWALRLPLEIFALIFHHIDEPREYACRQVCRQWKVLVDARYTLRCGIEIMNWDRSHRGFFFSTGSFLCQNPMRELPPGRVPFVCSTCQGVICHVCRNNWDHALDPTDTCPTCKKYQYVCRVCTLKYYQACSGCGEDFCTHHQTGYPMWCTDCEEGYCEECAEDKDFDVCEKCGFAVCGGCVSWFDGDPTCKSCRVKHFDDQVPDY